MNKEVTWPPHLSKWGKQQAIIPQGVKTGLQLHLCIPMLDFLFFSPIAVVCFCDALVFLNVSAVESARICVLQCKVGYS